MKFARSCFESIRKYSAKHAFCESNADFCLAQRGVRQLWASVPVEMGRRACKIADRKSSQALKRMKINNKFAKLIGKAVREGGPYPSSNLALAAILQQARDCNVGKEVIDRNLKKASDKDQQDFIESTYEAYGFGGVGIVVEVLTDNPNRAWSLIRDAIKRSGAKVADSGSVLFSFKRAGVISVKASGVKNDDLLLAAMDAGAEDVTEPTNDEDSNSEEKYYKVITAVDDYGSVNKKLCGAGFAVDMDNSGLELIPLAPVEADDEAADLNKLLIDKLLDLEDVDAVYSTQKT